jgi:TRAP-type C4-dicarboxylate transport system permease small subunit
MNRRMKSPSTDKPFWKSFLQIVDKTVNGLAILAGILLCLLTLLICVDALGRTLVRLFRTSHWGYTLPWTLEISEYALYLITFLGAPWVLQRRGHISIDLLVQAAQQRFSHRLLVTADIIGFSVCIILLYFSCKVWWISFSEKILIHETFVFPEWTIITLAPVSFLLMAIILIIRIYRPRNNSPQLPKSSGL